MFHSKNLGVMSGQKIRAFREVLVSYHIAKRSQTVQLSIVVGTGA